MARSIYQARSEEATRHFFSYKAPEPEPDPPAGTKMTREEWESLSPGYRREITRNFAPKAPPKVAPPDPLDRSKELRERKAQVEYAGRKRL